MTEKSIKKVSVVFFGTHNFAATILKSLINSELIDVKLVITQPDKPVGRKQALQASPVKVLAEKYGLPVEQPESLKSYTLNTNSYTIGVTAQYGLLIPKHILEAPELGILNVHTSLLPKYRGASPIQSALINGDKETGVTIMKMDVGLDTGPILLQKSLQIDPNDTYPILDQKLANIGQEALLGAIPAYVAGTLDLKKQDDSLSTSCRQFTRDDGGVDWKKTNEEIYNLYRGLTPWPGIWTTWDNKRLKLLKIKLSENRSKLGISGAVQVHDNKLRVLCGTGAIEILELQLEGKKAMDIKTFLSGYKNIDGQNLG